MKSNWRFHHVGIATNSIDSFSKRISDVTDGSEIDFEDPNQGIRGRFVEISDMRLEVLEPLENEETLTPWLTVGNRMYQIAFEVDDLDLEIKKLSEKRIRVVRLPLPAVAFNGRRVAFVMPVPGMLIELIESAN